MTFRYIGSKSRVADALRSAVSERIVPGARFIDGFAGTGAVAAAVADLGVPVVVNDTLRSAVTMSLARMVSNDEAVFSKLGGYANAIEKLNAAAPSEGPIHRNYSPASRFNGSVERRYFTEVNAAKIDGIRLEIADWAASRLISEVETTLLLGDLISAVNRAANIAGTYGCFLSSWQRSALEPISLRPRPLRAERVHSTGIVGDVHQLTLQPTDLVYYDPPYTKRQYASYYHILETIVVNDDPEVEGVSGLRPWKEKASVFCYKRKALNALHSLITKTAAQTVLLSYSCEGHVDLEDLVNLLGISGKVSLEALDRIGRYRPNVTASGNGEAVTEYLISYQGEGAKHSKSAWRNDELLKETA
ncbi:DNA adenine methylase [Sphingomonas sp. ac-8]|uniref:DNA adenine methylase n=1 Tax=Sphingomonas sp. ac-8 TaxID=3242977 RepID=UPI003A8013A2